MSQHTLSVRPVGAALVPDYGALDAGVLRFVGRHHDPSVGSNGGWVPDADPATIPARAEYIADLRQGALAPANEVTAKLAGVPFKS